MPKKYRDGHPHFLSVFNVNGVLKTSTGFLESKDDDPLISPAAEIPIIKIVQESLVNIRRLPCKLVTVFFSGGRWSACVSNMRQRSGVRPAEYPDEKLGCEYRERAAVSEPDFGKFSAGRRHMYSDGTSQTIP